MKILSADIKEFRANLHKYTKQTYNPIAITSDGVPMGYYIPVQLTPQTQELIALKETAQKITELLDSKGINPDELIADFEQERKNISQ